MSPFDLWTPNCIGYREFILFILVHYMYVMNWWFMAVWLMLNIVYKKKKLCLPWKSCWFNILCKCFSTKLTFSFVELQIIRYHLISPFYIRLHHFIITTKEKQDWQCWCNLLPYWPQYISWKNLWKDRSSWIYGLDKKRFLC